MNSWLNSDVYLNLFKSLQTQAAAKIHLSRQNFRIHSTFLCMVVLRFPKIPNVRLTFTEMLIKRYTRPLQYLQVMKLCKHKEIWVLLWLFHHTAASTKSWNTLIHNAYVILSHRLKWNDFPNCNKILQRFVCVFGRIAVLPRTENYSTLLYHCGVSHWRTMSWKATLPASVWEHSLRLFLTSVPSRITQSAVSDPSRCCVWTPFLIGLGHCHKS